MDVDLNELKKSKIGRAAWFDPITVRNAVDKKVFLNLRPGLPSQNELLRFMLRGRLIFASGKSLPININGN